MSRTHIATTLTRRAGLTLALLGLWLMALLVPLHQASGVQRELVAAGHLAASGWTLCPAHQQPGGDNHLPPLCPAQGIGKHDMALPPPAILPGRVLSLARDADRPAARPVPRDARGFQPGQPRAPPPV